MDIERGSGRVAAITGAGSGLGRALAVGLARRGWTLALSDLDDVSPAQTLDHARAAGGTGTSQPVDTRDPDAVAAWAAAVYADFGRCDLLVNNAGVGSGGAVGVVPLSEWRRCLDTNLLGPIHGCHFFLPRMRAQPPAAGLPGGAAPRGHVVNIASIAAFAIAPRLGPYNVSKAGVVALSETLRTELAGSGIGVTAVCPSFFRSNIARSAPEWPGLERLRARAIRVVDNARVGAEEVAEAVLVGVSRGAPYVFPQRDAQVMWRLKRLLPAQSLQLLAWVVKKAKLS